MKVNRIKTIENLKREQSSIQHESAEDEGAQEYHGEVQSCIDARESSMTDDEVIAAHELVWQTDKLVLEDNFLHIGQHWTALLIIGGKEFRPPAKLTNMQDIEVLKAEPFNQKVRIDGNNSPSWGEEVYRINHDKTLSFIGANYDTSD